MNITEEQKALMPIIVKKWIDRIIQPKPFDKEKAIKAVEWLYEFSELKKPKVLICDSPMACRLALGSIRDCIGEPVEPSISYSVGKHIYYACQKSETSSIGALDRFFVKDSINCFFSDKTIKSLTDFSYNTFSGYGWIALFEFLKEINQLKNQNFDKWLEYCDAGIFHTLYFENYCAICPMPEFFKTDTKNRLHSEEGMAIKWSDGNGIYALFGVVFNLYDKEDEEFYNKILKKELTLIEVLDIEDFDQRAAALKHCYPETIIQGLSFIK